jgi:hypothetical protein
VTKLSDNTLITKALLKRFELEAAEEGGNGYAYYALIRRSDGHFLAHHPSTPQLDPMQLHWATEALARFNRELHHDGAWVLVFTHPKPPSILVAAPNHLTYARYVFLWLDQDGDVQFPMDWMENETELLDFADVVAAGLESNLAHGEESWQRWHHLMRVVPDVKEGRGQTFKRAKGERAPSTVN